MFPLISVDVCLENPKHIPKKTVSYNLYRWYVPGEGPKRFQGFLDRQLILTYGILYESDEKIRKTSLRDVMWCC